MSVAISVDQLPGTLNTERENPNDDELAIEERKPEDDQEVTEVKERKNRCYYNEQFQRLKQDAEKYDESRNSEDSSKPVTKAKIHKVPEQIKEKYREKKYFKPKLIAIGPSSNHPDYSPETPTNADLLKLMWAHKYLNGLKGEEIFEGIIKEVGSLKELFHEEDVRMDDNDLAWMLFVDGCAVLQFIYSFVWGDPLKDLNIKEDAASDVQCDLFLLENQIPFRVLQIIMNHGPNKEQKDKPGQLMYEYNDRVLAKKSTHLQIGGQISRRAAKRYYKNATTINETLKLFISMSNVTPPPADETNFRDKLDPLKADNLLDLLRQALVGDDEDSSSTFFKQWWLMPWKLLVFIFWELPWKLLRYLVLFTLTIIAGCLLCLYCCATDNRRAANMLDRVHLILFCMVNIISPTEKSPISRRSFCRLQDAIQAGIKLKPCQRNCLSDVGFSSGFLAVNGCLKLLPMLGDKSTPCKLLNLVAYEMCSNPKKDHEGKEVKDRRQYAVTSYLSFLDSLIEDAQDVSELRAARILSYRLTNNQDIAQQIKDLSPSLVPEDMFSNDSAELRAYCSRRRPVWAAVFRKMYLSSPWAFLGLVGALIGLILTGISAYYAAFPK